MMQQPYRPTRASLIAALVAGPIFSLSAAGFFVLAMIPGSIFVASSGHAQSIGNIFGNLLSGGLFIAVTFAIPVGYILAIGLVLPCGATLDHLAVQDAKWSLLKIWLGLGALAGFLFGAFLCGVIRPGKTPQESFLLCCALLVGTSVAGASTAGLRHRLSYSRQR